MDVAAGKVLDAEEGAVPFAPAAGNVKTLRKVRVGASSDADGSREIHQPERGVEGVDANVHARTAATQLGIDEARVDRKPVAPGGIDTGVVDLTERANAT